VHCNQEGPHEGAPPLFLILGHFPSSPFKDRDNVSRRIKILLLLNFPLRRALKFHYLQPVTEIMSRDSAVGIATGYGLDD
jgi:hypothetical protein